MGYRSDVGIEFYTADAHKEAVVKLWLRENLPFKDWEWTDSPAFEELEDGFRFHVSNVKWYDGYPEVQRMDEIMEEFRKLFCDVDEPEGALEFVRIGEEDEDVEIHRYGDPNYRVNVSKEICFD